LKEDEAEQHWNLVALEARDSKRALRIEKWRNAARNRLADYADRRARDFILNTVGMVVKLDRFGKVLDVGCGSGKWATLYAKKCASVTAIDISQNMICLAEENARRENLMNVKFHAMNVSELEFPDEAYDLVNCVTVLQHMANDDDWRKAIREMARVTRKDGYVLLFEVAPSFAIKRRTRNLRVRTMQQYVNEFRKAQMRLVYWQAIDLSLPITYFGLKNYAASFNKRVYYFIYGKNLLIPRFLSFLSWATVLLARAIDYKLARTPLSHLSFGRMLLFQKTANFSE
jgi:ubiquinone/menaquinone biosynthesis C-methylase UbiE